MIPSEKKLILRSECSDLHPEQLQLLERKVVLPYEYLDCLEKLNENELPPKEAFYSKLNDSNISDEEYDFAQQIWNEFNVNSLGEYTDIYLRTNILLLADVFENFRKTCFDIYQLDPAHYVSAPSLSWNAMLKYTIVNIELLTDIDQLLFVERGI